MSLHNFIFSNERRHRVTRHVAFWLCWLLFASATQLTGLGAIPLVTIKDKILYQLARTLSRVPPQIFFCYTTVYLLVPLFIPKRKYLQFFFWLLILFMLLVAVTFLWFNSGGFSNRLLGVPTFSPFLRKFFSFYSNINFTGPIPACCLMLALKYYKDWDKKQKEGEILVRENIQSELQLLKAQIHPHFLFNTLNNIYSFTLTGSPQAAGLVDKLSGMIDYITIEGERSLVTLEKEIQLINDYIGLEKVRYGDRLDMQVEINGNYEDRLIAPLLMIPFVENCFKHGASVMRGQQWIRLSIHIKEDQLDFNLSNSKPPQTIDGNNKKGIGLTNVQKRLELLYPGKHFIKIESTSNTYMVRLQVSLQQINALDSVHKPTPKLQPV